MRLQLLQKNIGGNLEDNVGNKENSQSGVILSTVNDIQILFEAKNRSVTNVNPAPS